MELVLLLGIGLFVLWLGYQSIAFAFELAECLTVVGWVLVILVGIIAWPALVIVAVIGGLFRGLARS